MGFFGRHKKKIFFSILLLAVIFFVYRSKQNNISNIQTDIVKKQDIKQTVLATGQVTSQTNLSLSFKASGVVERVFIKVGDQVKEGQALARLSARDASARLTQARGALAQANANFQKVLAGASGEEAAVAEVALENAKTNLETTKKQQQVAVNNAFTALMNSTISAVAGTGNVGLASVSISGAYTSKEQGMYRITLSQTGHGLAFQVSGLESGSGEVKPAPVPLGGRGLFIQFSGTPVISDIWTITIPNTQAINYITNYNAYLAALENQKTAIASAENSAASAQANLDLKLAKARPADLEAARAQIITAQGQMEAAQADLENTIIRAPSSGTITKVDIKTGELATALKEYIVLQDVENLHVEANISEANIAALKLDQDVEVTFDAFGSDRKFKAQIKQIDPASTLVSGVVNYKVTASLDKLDEIRPGMTANLNILTSEKKNVLAIPQRAIVFKEGKKIVRIITDTVKKTFKEIEITTGLEADGGLAEALSGLNEGEEIVTLINSK